MELSEKQWEDTTEGRAINCAFHLSIAYLGKI